MREIKIHINKDRDGNPFATVFREGPSAARLTYEVLAKNGRWREKEAYSEIFDDEKFKVEVR